MRSIVATALSALVLVHSVPFAVADEFDELELRPAQYDWSGIYVGASVGYGWLEDADHQFNPPLPDKGEDWVAGAHIGLNYQVGSFVIGAEFEAMHLDIDYETFNFITTEEAYAIKGRVGYAVDRFLLSGHAGAAYLTTNFLNLDDWGYVIGLGIDYALTDHLIIGAQYSHLAFDEFDNTQIDGNLDLFTVRGSFKF